MLMDFIKIIIILAIVLSLFKWIVRILRLILLSIAAIVGLFIGLLWSVFSKKHRQIFMENWRAYWKKYI